MITEELRAYIQSQLDAGISKEELAENLKAHGGWTDGDVEEAFHALGNSASRAPQSAPAPGEERKEEHISDDVVKEGSHENDQSQSSILGMAQREEVTGKKSKFFVFVLVGLVTLGVLGGGAFAYFKFFPGLFFRVSEETPYDILMRLGEEVAKQTTVHNKGVFSLHITAQDNGYGRYGAPLPLSEEETEEDVMAPPPYTVESATIDAQVSYDVQVDTSNSESPKSEGVVDASVNVSTAGVDVSVKGGFEFRMLDNVLYVHITKIPDLAFFFGADPFVGLPYDLDSWFSFDTKEFTNRVMEESLMSEEEVNSLVSSMQSDSARMLQQKVREKLPEVFVEGELRAFVNRVVVPVEEANNEKDKGTYHFKFVLNEEDWKFLIKKGVNLGSVLLADEEFVSSMGLSDFEVAMIQEALVDVQEDPTQLDDFFAIEEVQAALGFLSKMDMQLWVDKKTYLPTRTTFRFNVDEFDASSVTLSLAVDFSDNQTFGVPVVVEAPPNAVSLVDIFIESIVQAQRAAQVAAIKGSIHNLRVFNELYYDANGSSYTGVCGGESAVEVFDYLKENFETVVYCTDSKSAWITWVLLPREDSTQVQGYYCADSTGSAGTTGDRPAENARTCPKVESDFYYRDYY